MAIGHLPGTISQRPLLFKADPRSCSTGGSSRAGNPPVALAPGRARLVPRGGQARVGDVMKTAEIEQTIKSILARELSLDVATIGETPSRTTVGFREARRHRLRDPGHFQDRPGALRGRSDAVLSSDCRGACRKAYGTRRGLLEAALTAAATAHHLAYCRPRAVWVLQSATVRISRNGLTSRVASSQIGWALKAVSAASSSNSP